MSGKKPKAPPSALSFRTDERALVAVLEASEGAKPATAGNVRNRINDAGAGDYFFPKGILKQLVEKVNNGDTGEIEIGERLDATLTIEISADKLSVTISSTRAYGGSPISHEQIQESLSQADVDPKCVNNDTLIQALEGPVDKLLIGEGTPPQRGEDSKFEMLMESNPPFAPEIDESGDADLHELQDFVHVEIGTPLMRRIPGTPGVPGTDVLGMPIEPVPGTEKQFAKKTDGAELDPNDENVLVACIEGHPVAISQGVKVDQTLVLKEVNLTTGNVSFEGSVEVRGDICSGFMVEADGDVRG